MADVPNAFYGRPALRCFREGRSPLRDPPDVLAIARANDVDATLALTGSCPWPTDYQPQLFLCSGTCATATTGTNAASAGVAGIEQE
jgi:hypothetical protein